MLDLQSMLMPQLKERKAPDGTATLQALAGLVAGGATPPPIPKGTPISGGSSGGNTDRRGEYERLVDLMNDPNASEEDKKYYQDRMSKLTESADASSQLERINAQMSEMETAEGFDPENPSNEYLRAKQAYEYHTTRPESKSSMGKMFADYQRMSSNPNTPQWQLDEARSILRAEGYTPNMNVPANVQLARYVNDNPDSILAKKWQAQINNLNRDPAAAGGAGNRKIEFAEWVSQKMQDGDPVATAEYNKLVKAGVITPPATRREPFLQRLDELNNPDHTPQQRAALNAKLAKDLHIPPKKRGSFIELMDELGAAKAAGDEERAAGIQARIDKLTYINPEDPEEAFVDENDISMYTPVIAEQMREWMAENPYATLAEEGLAEAGFYSRLGREVGDKSLYDMSEKIRKELPSGSKLEFSDRYKKAQKKLSSLQRQRAAMVNAGDKDLSSIDAQIGQTEQEARLYSAGTMGQEKLTDTGNGYYSSHTGAFNPEIQAAESAKKFNAATAEINDDIIKEQAGVSMLVRGSNSISGVFRNLDSSFDDDGILDYGMSFLPWTDNAAAEQFLEAMKGQNFSGAHKIIRESGGVGSITEKETQMYINMMGTLLKSGATIEEKKKALRTIQQQFAGERSKSLERTERKISRKTRELERALAPDSDKQYTPEQREKLTDDLNDLRYAQENLSDSRTIVDYQTAVADEISGDTNFISNPLPTDYVRIDGVTPITMSDLKVMYPDMANKADAVMAASNDLRTDGVFYLVDTGGGKKELIIEPNMRTLRLRLQQIRGN